MAGKSSESYGEYRLIYASPATRSARVAGEAIVGAVSSTFRR
jgi:hypothetical protein